MGLRRLVRSGAPPRAIGITLLVSMALYVAVGFVAVAAVGPEALARATEGKAAPLEIGVHSFDVPGVAWAVAAGAVTALLGVLLNLVLGLTRVWLAMARRGDAPRGLAASRLPPESRRYPRWIPALGVVACLGLAFFVEARIWLAGLGFAAVGLAWHLWRIRS